ncbi:hypothetical protein F4820DRAFT_456692 [Hypoxylon rubiginosum]|uniref:Uncharacterized protein n=1 Tax=Hypoxylon rubiginosum TaxID=110542 RepID=A0ACB9Z8G1_9PEZI|nr:hypothetical protein F4820DRAFT_456692 [Hypoxylon rubiginosum]
MPGGRIIIDDLWRCLCPSVDIASVSRLIGPSRSPRQRLNPPFGHNPRAHGRQDRREYRRVATTTSADQIRPDRDEIERSRIEYLKRLAKRSPWIPGALFEGIDSFATKLDRIPTKTIYAALKQLPRAQGTYHSVVKLVEYLVKERKERPNAILYESLIRANVDKNHGSAEVASQLLKEIEKTGIPVTPQIYQALLEVTAIHPDYVLRNTVLYEMKNRWYTPTMDDSVNIIVGLLRDNQYELALEKLEELHRDSIKVPSWLYDIFLYTFGDLGFHEETLSILQHRLTVPSISLEPLSLNTWQFLLDAFSRDAFYDGIKYVWNHSVSPGYLNPPDGVVMNVLNTASTHADAALAISAVETLSRRGKKLELHHFEALIDIHTQQNDLVRAFTILCIMEKADLHPDLSSTRSIFRILLHSASETETALKLLHKLRLDYKVPPAAFNVVLEAIIIHRPFKVALDMYRSVRQICIDGPDIETYHVLLAHCMLRKSMNFLFAEMKTFSIEPTWVTYDHLIRIYTMQDDYRQAFQFLDKMRFSKAASLPNDPWPSRDSALALIKRCIEAEDIRVQELIEGCRKRGMSIDAEVQQLLEAFQKRKELAEPDKDKGSPGEGMATSLPENDQTQKLNAASGWV